MATFRSRKIFQGPITVPPDAATSLNTLMQQSALKWGFESDGTTPSMDSILGSNVKIVPDSPIWIGSDSNVRSATVGSFYMGVPVAAGATYSLDDQGGGMGMIDPNQIYLYAINGTHCNLVFQSR